MNRLRKGILVPFLACTMLLGTAGTSDAGVVPWVWNALFGPPGSAWYGYGHGPGYGYYSGYRGYAYGGGYGCNYPVYPAYQQVYAPQTVAYAPAYSVGCAPSNCSTGCGVTAAYAPACGVVNDPYLGASACGTGCATGCGINVLPAGSTISDAYEPAKGGTDADKKSDDAGADAGDDAGKDVGDDFMTPRGRGDGEFDDPTFDVQERQKVPFPADNDDGANSQETDAAPGSAGGEATPEKTPPGDNDGDGAAPENTEGTQPTADRGRGVTVAYSLGRDEQRSGRTRLASRSSGKQTSRRTLRWISVPTRSALR